MTNIGAQQVPTRLYILFMCFFYLDYLPLAISWILIQLVVIHLSLAHFPSSIICILQKGNQRT